MSDEPTIRDIFYKLGALESKIDSVLSLQDNDRKRLSELEKRTSTLEKVEAKRTGMLVALAGFFSIISSVVVKYIASHMSIN